jgi:hypothetical protein
MNVKKTVVHSFACLQKKYHINFHLITSVGHYDSQFKYCKDK